MEHNTTYNLMNQLTQESKSLWRITNVYMKEAADDEQKTFWQKLAAEKEAVITALKELIKKAI